MTLTWKARTATPRRQTELFPLAIDLSTLTSKKAGWKDVYRRDDIEMTALFRMPQRLYHCVYEISAAQPRNHRLHTPYKHNNNHPSPMHCNYAPINPGARIIFRSHASKLVFVAFILCTRPYLESCVRKEKMKTGPSSQHLLSNWKAQFFHLQTPPCESSKHRQMPCQVIGLVSTITRPNCSSFW